MRNWLSMFSILHARFDAPLKKLPGWSLFLFLFLRLTLLFFLVFFGQGIIHGGNEKSTARAANEEEA